MTQRTRPVRSFSLPADVLERIKEAAAKERIPVSRWVERELAKAVGL